MAKGFYVQLPTPEGIQRWRVAYRQMANYGLTVWKSRTIWLKPNQTTADLVDTVIHEACHVATGFGSDQKVEESIERVANGATAMLLRLKLIAEDE
jgi:hypothetical protein